MTINDFETIKCETLLKHGFPKSFLWLTECITREDFIKFHGYDTERDLNRLNKKYVVYYHENGNVECTAFFDTLEEFQDGCKFLSWYMGGVENVQA